MASHQEQVLQLEVEGEETVTAVHKGPRTPPPLDDFNQSGPLVPQTNRRSHSRSTSNQPSEIPPKRGKMNDEAADEAEDPDDAQSVKSEDYTLEPRITVDELLIDEIRGMHQSIENMELTIAANCAPQNIPPDWIKNSNQISANLAAILRTNNDLIRANNSTTAALQRLVTLATKDQKSDLQKEWLKGFQDLAQDNKETRRAIQKVETAVEQLEGSMLRQAEPQILQLDPLGKEERDTASTAQKINRGCVLCQRQNHPTDICKSYVGSDRIQRAQQLNICIHCLEVNPNPQRGKHTGCPSENIKCRRCVGKVIDSRAANHNVAFCSYKALKDERSAEAPQPPRRNKTSQPSTSAQSRYFN
ncbi:hypothetical protein GCK72_020356 [Caenorhabditis remanei]|uniref:Uncharacterized protein n=1 Tax=Caenorhabditis remanei TaxID=31234 RepID=A0A6A5GH88_CAERE|nr:hypothetical protein GCK72_020356 [Caenorhabditis remanei]KAF1753799.1 hypothetical protein GCK72_020356 [Caenorhabditis remanei]